MGKITGFLEFERLEEGYMPVDERLKNYKEIIINLKPEQYRINGAIADVRQPDLLQLLRQFVAVNRLRFYYRHDAGIQYPFQ